MLKALRGLAAFALIERLIDRDPITSHKAARGKDTGGFKTWPQEYTDAYRKRHPLGTKARVALELLLNVGARCSDTIDLVHRANPTTILVAEQTTELARA